MITDDKIKELRAVAEAATPGPWFWDDCVEGGGYECPPEKSGPTFVGSRRGEGIDLVAETEDGKRPEMDARHIAAFDPPTALELLDRVERAEGQVRALCDARDRVALAMPVGWASGVVEDDLEQFIQHKDRTIARLTAENERLRSTKALEELVRQVVSAADYDIGKGLHPETAEDPDEVGPELERLVAVARAALDSDAP